MRRTDVTIHRWMGDSHEPKPLPGLQTDGVVVDSIPAGSSFMEEDTGRIYRWNGLRWNGPVADEDDGGNAIILAEIRALRKEIRTGLPVETGAL